MPIYEILEEAFGGDITLLVVNARHMKNVPGKKTDMRDSEWISTLLYPVLPEQPVSENPLCFGLSLTLPVLLHKYLLQNPVN